MKEIDHLGVAASGWPSDRFQNSPARVNPRNDPPPKGIAIYRRDARLIDELGPKTSISHVHDIDRNVWKPLPIVGVASSIIKTHWKSGRFITMACSSRIEHTEAAYSIMIQSRLEEFLAAA